MLLDWHSQFCEIVFNGKIKTVFMDSIHNFDTEESLRFDKVMKVIIEIVENREELKRFHEGIWWF